MSDHSHCIAIIWHPETRDILTKRADQWNKLPFNIKFNNDKLMFADKENDLLMIGSLNTYGEFQYNPLLDFLHGVKTPTPVTFTFIEEDETIDKVVKNTDGEVYIYYRISHPTDEYDEKHCGHIYDDDGNKIGHNF